MPTWKANQIQVAGVSQTVLGPQPHYLRIRWHLRNNTSTPFNLVDSKMTHTKGSLVSFSGKQINHASFSEIGKLH
jgi:hypothetical protein